MNILSAYSRKKQQVFFLFSDTEASNLLVFFFNNP